MKLINLAPAVLDLGQIPIEASMDQQILRKIVGYFCKVNRHLASRIITIWRNTGSLKILHKKSRFLRINQEHKNNKAIANKD